MLRPKHAPGDDDDDNILFQCTKRRRMFFNYLMCEIVS